MEESPIFRCKDTAYVREKLPSTPPKIVENKVQEVSSILSMEFPGSP